MVHSSLALTACTLRTPTTGAAGCWPESLRNISGTRQVRVGNLREHLPGEVDHRDRSVRAVHRLGDRIHDVDSQAALFLRWRGDRQDARAVVGTPVAFV